MNSRTAAPASSGMSLQGRHLAGERLLRGGVDLADALVAHQRIEGGLCACCRVVAGGPLGLGEALGLGLRRAILRLVLRGGLRLGGAHAVRGRLCRLRRARRSLGAARHAGARRVRLWLACHSLACHPHHGVTYLDQVAVVQDRWAPRWRARLPACRSWS